MAISQTQTMSGSVLVTNHFEKLKHFGNLRATGCCIEYVSVLPQGRSMEIPREAAVSFLAVVHFKIMQTSFMRQSMNLIQSQPETCALQGSASFNIQHIHVTEQQSAIFAYNYINEMVDRHWYLIMLCGT